MRRAAREGSERTACANTLRVAGTELVAAHVRSPFGEAAEPDLGLDRSRYAVRVPARDPLRRPDAGEPQALACCLPGHGHDDGIHVLLDHGRVVLMTWADLGLRGPEEFEIGEGGPYVLRRLAPPDPGR